MNKTIKKVGLGFGIFLVAVLIWVLWYFNIFGLSKQIENIAENNSQIIENKPLNREEQKSILDNLAPEKELTESEKEEQLNILDDLQKQQPVNKDLDLLKSLGGNTNEEEQLKLLESLKN